MPEISVDVAGRNYRLICGDGEEQHLQTLVGLVDAEARALAKGRGAQMAEARLMLMSALMVADRLHDAQARIAELETELESRPNGGDPAREAGIAEQLDLLASRAEKVAAAADDRG